MLLSKWNLSWDMKDVYKLARRMGRVSDRQNMYNEPEVKESMARSLMALRMSDVRRRKGVE